ncbi:enoyl-CoA hydratase/isomerase family protein [Microbacterium sp.]|uniref:enoyl-CoA hydratase/isomerase family protein n=1 Tax=Microbacterium sp. TaxID=51671 RepID=UPI0037C72603
MTAAGEDTVLSVTRTGDVWRLTLRRPHAGNAVDQRLADAFAATVAELVAEDEPQLVVLASEGSQFCTGGDVTAVATAADPGAYLVRLAATMHDALEALRASAHIVVAAVQGAAAGAGLALVLNADLVVASEQAVFLSAYAGVGLTPDCGVTHLLPATVGPRRAAELTLTGRVLTAPEARDWGIVNTVVDDLSGHLDALLEQLTAGPRWAQSRTLRLLGRDDLDFHDHLAAELEGLAAQIALPDTVQRLHRFIDRR